MLRGFSVQGRNPQARIPVASAASEPPRNRN
jgi:hypothetical protein